MFLDLRRSALDIGYFVTFPSLKFLNELWFGTFHIVDVHAVADELGRVRLDVLNVSQLVDRVQRVRRLPRGVELVPLGPGARDVAVGQVELGLLKADVQLSWARSINVKVLIAKLWSVNVLSNPNLRCGA